jgi:DnaK suppressor protein
MVDAVRRSARQPEIHKHRPGRCIRSWGFRKKQVSMSKRSRKNEIEPLRALLLKERDELNRRIEQRRQEIVAEQEPDDEAGLALRNSSAGMAIANIERELRTLAEIELSLRRIKTREYGICSVCGETIPMSRLEAIPWTRCCVECAGGARPVERSRARQPHTASL